MQMLCKTLDSGFAAISAFTRVFDALWRRPGMTEDVQKRDEQMIQI